MAPAARAERSREYIWMKRRRQSSANRSPGAAARPATAAVVRPRFRIVSIIPGIEDRAPDRTETRSGFARIAEAFPAAFSSRGRAPRSTSAQTPSSESRRV